MPKLDSSSSLIKRVVAPFRGKPFSANPVFTRHWKEGKISKGILREARKSDSALADQIGAYSRTGNIDDLGNGVTHLSLVASRRELFLTPAESERIANPSQNGQVFHPIRVADIRVQDVTHKLPGNVMGGIIRSGSILVKVAKRNTSFLVRIHGRVKSENLAVCITPFFERGEVPKRVRMDVKDGQLHFFNGQGNVFLSRLTNIPEGLAVFKMDIYLDSIPSLTGYFYKKVTPRGLLVVERTQRLLPTHAGQHVKIEFDHGHMKVFSPDDALIDEFDFQKKERPYPFPIKLSRKGAEIFTGEVSRITNPEGGFVLGQRSIYLGPQYGRQQILLTLDRGAITGILDESGHPIDLASLSLLNFYDDKGGVAFQIPARYHLNRKHFEGKRGWVKIDLNEPEKGGDWFFAGEVKLIKPGYPAIFARIENGIVTGIQYFSAQASAPWKASPDQETIYKRVYLKGELEASFDQLKSKALQRVQSENGRITHWKIGSGGMIMINNQHVYFYYKYPGKYLILDFEGNKVKYRVYDQPEADPAKPCLQEGKFNLAIRP